MDVSSKEIPGAKVAQPVVSKPSILSPHPIGEAVAATLATVNFVRHEVVSRLGKRGQKAQLQSKAKTRKVRSAPKNRTAKAMES
jgi:hypothetical protein